MGYKVLCLFYSKLQPGNYGKKRASTFYSSPNSPEMPKPMVSVGHHGTWRANKKSMTSSVPNTVSKGSSGRIIRIVNGHDHSVQVRSPHRFFATPAQCVRFIFVVSQCRVLLNLRTTQPFEEVLDDLGQVLKMGGAKRMFTLGGQEVGGWAEK
jgi:echinoderm microtubule-associated protein-like 1/2